MQGTPPKIRNNIVQILGPRKHPIQQKNYKQGNWIMTDNPVTMISTYHTRMETAVRALLHGVLLGKPTNVITTYHFSWP